MQRKVKTRKINKFAASFTLACASFIAQASCNQESLSKIEKDSEKRDLESKIQNFMQSFQIKVRSEEEVRDMLGLLQNESRTYIMSGIIGNDNYNAYVSIGRNYYDEFTINIKLLSNKLINTKNIILYPSECEMEIESGRLVIRGFWGKSQNIDPKLSNKKFIFKICEDCDLNEVDFINFFKTSVKNKGGKQFTYTMGLSLPFIPEQLNTESNKIPRHVRKSINVKLSGLESKQAISKKLFKQDLIDKDGMPLKLDFNAEYLTTMSLGYVSSRLLMFLESNYVYEGGAHGNTILNVRAFSLQNGEELPTNIEDLFDMQRQDEILTLLTKKLQPQKDRLYDLPLSQMPDTFIFDDNGATLMWQAYSIAPYSSGHIEVHVDFSELANFVKKDSVYEFLFKN